MAISAFKTFADAEVLTADDLNSSFTQATDNGEDLGWKATESKKLSGQLLVMDADSDTKIGAPTDDVIDIIMGGQKLYKFDGSAASTEFGTAFLATISGTAPIIQSVISGKSINLVSLGTGVNQHSGNTMSGTDESQWVISRQVYGG